MKKSTKTSFFFLLKKIHRREMVLCSCWALNQLGFSSSSLFSSSQSESCMWLQCEDSFRRHLFTQLLQAPTVCKYCKSPIFEYIWYFLLLTMVTRELANIWLSMNPLCIWWFVEKMANGWLNMTVDPVDMVQGDGRHERESFSSVAT